MNKRFLIRPALCIGCRTCELACSLTHQEKNTPGRSRIYPIAVGKEKWVPVACLQCDDPACVKSCLVDALRLNEELGYIELLQDRCIKCRACVAACPFGCSLIDEEQEIIVKCDLCEGNPACARFCPTKALEYK
jgi:carbon-monoxide dehydrogenase iron sulfur subunit